MPLVHLRVGDLRERLLAVWVAGAAHLGFYDDVVRHRLLDIKPECVPWYYERFTRNGTTLKTESAVKELDLITAYFGEHFFPWWRHVLGAGSADVRLFNADSLCDVTATDAPARVAPRIDDLANLDWPHENDKRTLDVIDAYFSDSAEIGVREGGEAGTPAYLSILALAARRFVTHEYKRVADNGKGN